jgi:hypothetical protein
MNPIAYSSPTQRESPLRGAKGVFDPDHAVFARRETFQGEHIEAHRVGAPRRLPLQEVAGGADDLALFARRDRPQRSAEVAARALAHFHHYQKFAVPAHEVDFSGLAAHVARKQLETLGLEVAGGKLLGCAALPPAQLGDRSSLYHTPSLASPAPFVARTNLRVCADF